MNAFIKQLIPFSLVALLVAGCGGGGSSSPPGALEAGGTGVTLEQIDDGTGTAVTVNYSAALDVNGLNQVIGFAEVTAGNPFAASLWTVDTSGDAVVQPVALAPLVDGQFAAAFAIDEDGRSVGQADDGTRLVAVLWANPAAPVTLPQLAATGNYAAYAISADGTLVVGSAMDATGATRAVIWQADGNGDFVDSPVVLPVNIFASSGVVSHFSAANGVARVDALEILVVGEAIAGNGDIHAALWRSTDGGAGFVPVNLGVDYVANAVNSARQVAGEADATLSPVTWTISELGVASAPVDLAAAGSAVAINENGRVAGWSEVAELATVWDGLTAKTLFNTASQAYGLNNDTQPLVVGQEGGQGFIKRAN